MLKSVNQGTDRAHRMLIIDTCGEGAGVVVSAGSVVAAAEDLPRAGGSVEIVEAVRRALQAAGCSISELQAIGVVSGPGSFTGVRVGMAVAKGLSEASEVRMLTVSRLQVLREAGAGAGLAVLDAGRGECYARDASGREWLATVDDLRAAGGEIVVAEEKVAARLKEAGLQVREWPLSVADALLPLLRAAAKDHKTDVLSDANYVRRESEIYPGGQRASGSSKGSGEPS